MKIIEIITLDRNCHPEGKLKEVTERIPALCYAPVHQCQASTKLCHNSIYMPWHKSRLAQVVQWFEWQ